MPLQLWLGGSGSGKSHRLYETIIKEARENMDVNYFVLVPEQFTLQTQRDIVMLHPDEGIINIDVLSFNRLSYRIFEEVGFGDNNGIVIDDMGKNLIIRHLAGEHKDDLKVIAGNLKRLGYITEVKSIISEFMQYGVDNEKIAKLREISESNNRHLLCDKLDDIKILYDAFREYIKEKYTTTEELLSRASHAVCESSMLKNSVIVLDGYTGFTPVQYSFIEALMKVCKDIHVTILADGPCGAGRPYDENDLFFLSDKTVRELKHITEQNKYAINEDIVISDDIPIRYRQGDSSPNMLIHLEKNIFRQKNKLNNICDDCESADVRILSALNPLEEMSYVAVLIDNLVRNEGYRYSDIAIVTGALDTYMHAADRVFPKYNIRYFIDRKQPILLNPFIEYMRSLMRVIIENYSFDAMFSYLKSSLTGIDMDSVIKLENYCLAVGIKGRKRWNERFIRHTSDIDEEELLHLNEIREKIVEPFSLFDDCKTTRDYCTALHGMLITHDIQRQLRDRSISFENENEDVLAKEYKTIYASVIGLFDKLVELLGDEEISVEEFYELLNAGFSELKIGIVPKTTDYVQIGDLTRSRFRDIKALFFVGVNEGIIPMSNSVGGLLSDIDREFFCEKGSDVDLAPTSRMQSYTQRLYLYMALTKPREKLYISYCGVGDDGNAVSPSYLIGEIKGMYKDIIMTDYSSLSMAQRVCTEENGLTELAGGLQDYAKKMAKSEDCVTDTEHELFEYFAQKEQYYKTIITLVNTAFDGNQYKLTNSVTSKIAHVIYGETIQGSITRLEMYAKCAYEHFLKYGLKLKEREEFSFTQKEMGTVLHNVLEIFSKSLIESGQTWATISDDDAIRLTLDAVQTVTNNQSAIYDTYRTTYMVKRIERIMIKSVLTLKEHVIKGDFVPSRFELEFVKAREDLIKLSGRIDRMDVYKDDNRIYVKVIDFKSGDKDIDLAAIYRGEQLQLVVYMNAAVDSLSEQNPDCTVIPAGILYYHLDDPLVDSEIGEDDETIKGKINLALAMKGLINSDEDIFRHMDNDITGKSNVIPVSINKNGSLGANSSVVSGNDFKIISDYVNSVILDMGQEILDGNIEAKPGNCKYCEYASICKLSGTEGVKPEKLTDDEAITRMREKLENA